MKRNFLPTVVAFLVSLIATAMLWGQTPSADMNTPIARSSEAKYRIDLFYFQRNATSLFIDVTIQDASNVDIRTVRYAIPSAAGAAGTGGQGVCTSATTIAGLSTAMNNARSGETGGSNRIQQFRILGYLADQLCLGTVTLVP